MKPYRLNATSFAAVAPIHAHAASDTFVFPLKVSPGAKTCLPKAHGNVIDHTFGNVENLEVIVRDLPPNTDFVLFNIQVPNPPFGLAWYNRDILESKYRGASFTDNTAEMERLAEQFADLLNGAVGERLPDEEIGWVKQK